MPGIFDRNLKPTLETKPESKPESAEKSAFDFDDENSSSEEESPLSEREIEEVKAPQPVSHTKEEVSSPSPVKNAPPQNNRQKDSYEDLDSENEESDKPSSSQAPSQKNNVDFDSQEDGEEEEPEEEEQEEKKVEVQETKKKPTAVSTQVSKTSEEPKQKSAKKTSPPKAQSEVALSGKKIENYDVKINGEEKEFTSYVTSDGRIVFLAKQILGKVANFSNFRQLANSQKEERVMLMVSNKPTVALTAEGIINAIDTHEHKDIIASAIQQIVKLGQEVQNPSTF